MIKPFSVEPMLDLVNPANKKKMEETFAEVARQFGKNYPLIVGGERIFTEDKIVSLNPSNKVQVVGYVSKAKPTHVDKAIAAAEKAFDSWKRLDLRARAACLFRAASIMRKRRYELAAWVAYECGRSWGDADFDIVFTIENLEYYGTMVEHIRENKNLIHLGPNEDARMIYIPLGVGAVISPWNFPIALMGGMVGAAVVAGNAVLIKPSSLTPVVTYLFTEIMEQAGIPAGVINFLPGSGSEVGDYIIEHPRIRFIAFTGSKDVGVHINQLAAKQAPGQKWIKRVIMEMGGKDAIFVDSDVDNLDYTADAIINGAFGYQGQKCAACSRVIIHEKNYDALAEKIAERAKKLTVGPVENNPDQGPVVEEAAFRKIMNYIEIGRKEGKLLCGGVAGSDKGYFIMPTVFGDIQPDAVLAQEEIFGPVLSLIKVKSFEEGIEVFNNTIYGLTGAFFSSNRTHLEIAKQELHCGNLDLNTDCTYSIVGASPFGGFNMSGTDSKTGSTDFMSLFVQPKTIVEVF